jgi:hypothetical protein
MVSMVGEWCMCLRFALSGLLLFDVQGRQAHAPTEGG